MPARARLAVVLLLLCGMVAAQSQAWAAAHQVHQATQHCCLLCHFGPLPLVQAEAPATPAPLLSVAWLEADRGFESTHDVFLSTSSSRAPPA